jgi:hypothetical protein
MAWQRAHKNSFFSWFFEKTFLEFIEKLILRMSWARLVKDPEKEVEVALEGVFSVCLALC